MRRECEEVILKEEIRTMKEDNNDKIEIALNKRSELQIN